MKYEKWFTLLSGFFLSLLVSFSCTACIATAFDLHIESEKVLQAVDLKKLLLFCAAISMLMSVFHTWRLGALAPCTMLVLFLYFWHYEELKLSVEALCNSISIRYDNAYDWGELRWSTQSLLQVDRTLALQVLAMPLSAAVSWTVCRRQELIWALAAAILPIVPCTIITSTVPDAKQIGLWLMAIVLLLMTQAARKRSARQGNRLLALLALPVAIAVVLLFRIAPQEGYDGKKTADALLQKVQEFFSISASGSAGTNTKKTVDLTDVGNMRQRRVPVMTITAPTTETYYLRGRAYDVYTGTQWKDSGNNYDLPWREEQGERIGTLSIKTRYKENVLYFPYNSEYYLDRPLIHSLDSTLENEEGLTEYSYDIYDFPTYMESDGDKSVRNSLTELPESTKAWAEEYVDRIFSYTWEKFTPMYSGPESGIKRAHLLIGIKDFLAEKASYDLRTPKMSAEYDDFAQWFLEESDTGYCVHFATTATVLLRAAGIPARYVTGYAVEAVEGQEVTVYEKDAHAWVEYWQPSIGWQILDPTPAEEERPAYSATESSTTEATTTVSTQPATTTAPTQETQPTTTKQPSDPAGTSTGNREKTVDLTLLWQIIKFFLYAALLVGIVFGQWKLRISLQLKARQIGKPNERALKAWRQVSRYAKALQQKPDKELKKLAQKAKFSQHELSEDELQAFETYFGAAITELRRRPWYCRLRDRIVFALY